MLCLLLGADLGYVCVVTLVEAPDGPLDSDVRRTEVPWDILDVLELFELGSGTVSRTRRLAESLGALGGGGALCWSGAWHPCSQVL